MWNFKHWVKHCGRNLSQISFFQPSTWLKARVLFLRVSIVYPNKVQVSRDLWCVMFIFDLNWQVSVLRSSASPLSSKLLSHGQLVTLQLCNADSKVHSMAYLLKNRISGFELCSEFSWHAFSNSKKTYLVLLDYFLEHYLFGWGHTVLLANPAKSRNWSKLCTSGFIRLRLVLFY